MRIMGSYATRSSEATSKTPVITYTTPSERAVMKTDITNQIFANYEKYGATDGAKANKMIIDDLQKDGLIDSEMAESLRKTDNKAKKLFVDVNKKVKDSQTSGGGLGMNPGYRAVTSTYKRAMKRRKKRFDEWWNGNNR